MKQPKLNQRVKIWRHLLRHGSITQEVALARYGAARLAARIEELRDLGVPILTQMMTSEGRRSATYLLQRKASA